MTSYALVAAFEVIANAGGGISRIREAVMDLALAGRLVPQLASEEDAATLVGRIEDLRAKRILDGLSGRQRPVPPLDIPVNRHIPPSWQWTCLAALGELSPRNDAPDSVDAGFLPMATIPTDVRGKPRPEIRPWGRIRRNYTHVADGDIAVAKITPCYQNGKSCVFSNLPNGIGAGTTELHVLRPVPELLEPRYLLIALKSPSFLRVGATQMTGTAGQQRVPRSYFAHTPVPLPPLQEQARIVERVDELMGLCDRLEERTECQKRTARDLGTSTFMALASSARGRGLQEAWSRTKANWRTITADSESVDGLSRCLLALAVRGLLVPQDPRDEPAPLVLAKKHSLPKNYERLRRIRARGFVDVERVALPELPASWAYSSVQELYDQGVILDFADGNHGSLYPRKHDFGDTGVSFVTAKQIRGGRVDLEAAPLLRTEKAEQLKKGWARGGDVLLTHNATVGRTARVSAECGEFLLGTSATFYRVNPSLMSPDFLYYCLSSEVWLSQMRAVMEQTTRSQVSIQKQAFFQLPFAPRSEQDRIVRCLDLLTARCSSLAEYLRQAEQLAESLAWAAVVRRP